MIEYFIYKQKQIGSNAFENKLDWGFVFRNAMLRSAFGFRFDCKLISACFKQRRNIHTLNLKRIRSFESCVHACAYEHQNFKTNRNM